MGKLVILSILLVQLSVSDVQAETVSEDISRSEFWFNYCQKEQAVVAACAGYVQGYLDGIWRSRELTDQLASNEDPKEAAIVKFYAAAVFNRSYACTTADVTYVQAVRVWVKYLKNTPEEHHLPAHETFAKAMSKTFPCQ